MDEERQVSFEAMEHRALSAKKKTQSFFVQLFSTALDVLSRRILVFLSLVATSVLFGWAMMDPVTLRLVIAAVFALSVFIPVLLTTKEKNDGE